MIFKNNLSYWIQCYEDVHHIKPYCYYRFRYGFAVAAFLIVFSIKPFRSVFLRANFSNITMLKLRSTDKDAAFKQECMGGASTLEKLGRLRMTVEIMIKLLSMDTKISSVNRQHKYIHQKLGIVLNIWS